MKTIKYLLFLLLILTIGFSIYIAVQPNDFKVSKTQLIKAPSQVVYNHVIDFKNWKTWSTWSKENLESTIVISDSVVGIGNSYSWTDSEGTGSIKTLETIPLQSIDQEIQFDKFEPAQMQWEFKQISARETEVIWTVSSESLSFYEKAYALINGSPEKMMRPILEQSMNQLQDEVLAALDVYSIKVDGIAQHGGGYYIYTTTSSKISDIQTTIGNLMPRVKSYALQNNLAMAGAPFIIYHTWDEPNNAVMFSCAIPTTTQVTTTKSNILSGQLEPFKAVKTTLKGNYTNLKEAWDASYSYINQFNMQTTDMGPMLEVYLTDPSQKPNPANWITEIYIAIN